MARLQFLIFFVIFPFALPAIAIPQDRPGAAPQGYIGVVLGAAPPQLVARYAVSGPAIGAASVSPNGPAYKSGLREGDLITSIDGNAVNDVEHAAALLRRHKVGDKVRIGLLHLQSNGQRIAIEIGVVMEARPPGYGGRSDAPAARLPASAAPAQNPGGLRLIGENAVRAYPKQAGYCQAFAPRDWAMRSRPQGDTADLDGAGGLAHAGWGMIPINATMRARFGDPHTPEAVALQIASVVAHAPARWTGAPQNIGGFFTAQNFEAGAMIGSVLYHVFPAPMPGQYVIGNYYAAVDRRAANLLPTAQAVMTSIRCQTHLRPSQPTPPGKLPRPGDVKIWSPGTEEGSLRDYNVQLGTQWAHSPSTGEHFLLDYATQWNSSGPDGPGYYRKTGSNSWEKLATGW